MMEGALFEWLRWLVDHAVTDRRLGTSFVGVYPAGFRFFPGTLDLIVEASKADRRN